MYECDVWERIRELIAQALLLMDQIPQDSDPDREFNYRLYLQRLLDEDFTDSELALLSDLDELEGLDDLPEPEDLALPDFLEDLVPPPPIEPVLNITDSLAGVIQSTEGAAIVDYNGQPPIGGIEFQVGS